MKTFSSLSRIALLILSLNPILSMAADPRESILQSKLQDLYAAYGWECSGAACYAVWREEVRSINAVVDYVDGTVTDQTHFSERTGSLAKQNARRICSSSAYADPNTIHWLVTNENRALNRLALIQELAGIQRENIYTCNRTAQ